MNVSLYYKHYKCRSEKKEKYYGFYIETHKYLSFLSFLIGKLQGIVRNYIILYEILNISISIYTIILVIILYEYNYLKGDKKEDKHFN